MATGNGTRLPNLDHCPDEREPGFDPLKIDGGKIQHKVVVHACLRD